MEEEEEEEKEDILSLDLTARTMIVILSSHGWANVPLHLLTLEILSEEKPQNLFLLIGYNLDLEINISAKVC